MNRKQNATNEEWKAVWDNIEQSKQYKQVDDLATATIENIRKGCKGKHCAFGWSGGKDSIVLADLCAHAGISESVCVLDREIEYPGFLEFVDRSKPKGCTVIDRKLGYKFLLKHQDLLFPTKKMLPRWYRHIQHIGQEQYVKNNSIDILFLGRRKGDGNYIRGNGPLYIVTNKRGVTVSAPVADWENESILAYIKKRKLALPPIYDYPDGWRQGTHVWPARIKHESGERGNWQEVYAIDHGIVHEAARYFVDARKFLEDLGQ